ncbi:MAG TPA: nucleoside 2-deoxyribosyltransferase [Candidatus Aphodocola excrementigallinarum]|uniref:Nucleoside 2-deoxyribosyltransferase n=1 Tax=Candidatus Aphodocola excrementigallinarum TaxID=2840670 RepID=A0A9D1IQ08_9FIRM|nr:nucleoside 2-deoxyribosyltransferase [Candidatus Aphodocola excrementigallinarum]
MDNSKNKKIYIAGFDVFKDDAIKTGDKYKEICKLYGFTGLYPLDNVAFNANDIFKGDIRLIDESDIIVANLNNFRGQTMDDGTAFELGYGYALGKLLYGYMDDDRSMREKIGYKDSEGYNVEDFDKPINLMIAQSTKIVKGDFESCVKRLKRDLTK